jgi:uncharacterized protein YdaU (DUF1376 family)
MTKSYTYDPTIWMPFYIGDTLADTIDLSCEQFGALILIRAHYWRNQGPVLNNDERLATVCRLSPDALRKIKPTLMKYFDLVDGQLVDKNLDHRITEAWKHKVRATARASKAARVRWGEEKKEPDEGGSPN